LLLMAALSACAGTAGRPANGGPPAIDPGPIRPPSALGFDFQWRQRVTASWPTGSRSFDAVLQRRNGELLLLGLSPIGQPGFILRLRETGAIEVENRTGHELPFRPEYILADVERVFFPWLPAVPAAFSGERKGRYEQLEIAETYDQGRLLSRRFVRVDAPQSGAIRITYQPLAAGADASPRVSVDNAWFRYRLVIETLEQSRL
jgi:hypothetical protein